MIAILRKNIILILPIAAFLLLTVPFLDVVPFLDGNIDFVKSYDFLHGGFRELFKNWNSVHPPFKEIVNYLFFKTFGVNEVAYNLPGLISGVSGIVAFFFLTKKLFNKKVSLLASLLLSVNALYISLSIFSLTDFILTNLIILSLYFYRQKRYLAFSVFGSFTVLTKETGILMILSVYLIELSYIVKALLKKERKKTNFQNGLLVLLPFLVYLSWTFFLGLYDKKPWSDWNFSSVSYRGTVYTIIHNLITFNFLNKYAYQNWGQLFFMNFNWIFWITILVGLISSIFNKRTFILAFRQQDSKTFWVLVVFSVAYFFMVLSFQTYTIPRYALPIYPLMIILVCHAVFSISKNNIGLLYLLISVLSLFVVMGLLTSTDPVSIKLWGKTNVMGKPFYGINNHLAGNDGLTYNIQYLTVARKRTFYFNNEESLVNFDIRDCHWIFLDPRNDIKTANVLSLNTSLFAKCKILR